MSGAAARTGNLRKIYKINIKKIGILRALVGERQKTDEQRIY